MADTLVNAQEVQTIYGPVITTHELNNSTCVDCNGASFDHECFGDRNWCFGKHSMWISAPPGWHFVGQWRPHCVQDNQGSFGWNMGYSNHWQVIEHTPNYIEVIAYFSSRSIIANLSCDAVKE